MKMIENCKKKMFGCERDCNFNFKLKNRLICFKIFLIFIEVYFFNKLIIDFYKVVFLYVVYV